MNTDLLPSPVFGRIMLVVSPVSLLDTLFDMVTRLALQDSLYVLDGGNSFQGYSLACKLRQSTPDVAAPMQRVMLSRAFTCYQMAALLEEGIFSSRPILVLDFLSTFYDQGVRVAERRRLLHVCLRRLRALSQCVPVAVWIRQRSTIPEEGLQFLEMVQAAAGQVWSPPRHPVLPAAQQLSLF